MPRTDNYQWTVTSGSTFQHGTFLCGEPWVVDNGDLTLTAVTPTETQSELEPTLGISGSVNCTVLNPDTGKVLPHETYYQNENYDASWLNYSIKQGNTPVQGQFVYCVDGISAGAVAGDDIRELAADTIAGIGPAGVMIFHDYRGGLFLGSTSQEQQSAGLQFFPGNTLGLPASLEAGDMVMTSYGVTGSVYVLNANKPQPFTESLGVLTVLASAPGASAFRPPINWDPTDKANRPIYYEVDDLSLDQNGNSTLWSYPDYNFSSDTKTYTDGDIARKDVDDCLARCGTVDYLPFCYNEASRGTSKIQANTPDEYGSYCSMVESSMFMHMFDPNVAGSTRDIFRRVLTQRGIDIHGAVHSLGLKTDQVGGFNQDLPSKQMLAWAVTEDSTMYTHLDGLGWGAGGSGTHWPQKQMPNQECYGDYAMMYQDRAQMSFSDNSCSSRHFDLEVIDVGTADNLHYVHVKRPRNRLDYTGAGAGTTYGNPPLWLSNDSNSSPSNWGASDNGARVADDNRFMSGYLRVKGQSGGQPYSAITRVVDEIYYYDGLTVGNVYGVSDADMRAAGVTGATGHWDKNPTDGIWYLQHNVIPDDGGITGADFSNSLQETRGLHPVAHVTFGLANSGGPSSPNAYGYVVCANLMGKWKMCDIKGGVTADNIPYLLKREAKKAIWMASTNEGKNYLFWNASTYNDKRGAEIEPSAWAALMRQGPGGGASLPPSPKQRGEGWGASSAGSTAESFWPMPSTTTWEEINYDLSKVKIFARYRATNGSYGWHRYQDFTGTGGGSAGTTFADSSQMTRTNTSITGVSGHAEMVIGAGSFEHKYFDADALGWKAYFWPPGLTFPFKLRLKSSNASGPTDTSWEDRYELYRHLKTENVIMGQEGPYPSVFFAEDPILTPGSGFAAAFDSDYDNTARFGQSVFRGEYTQSATMDGAPRNEMTGDNFARVSYPNLNLGQPNIYSATGDFDLDIYAYHGAGIKEVEVVADGGTPVKAVRVNSTENRSALSNGGHYQIPIEFRDDAKGFSLGTTSEIRITAKPYNGYDRTVQLRLSGMSGENKVTIDPSSTIASAYDTVIGSFDETKRNLVELSVSGGYTMGVASAGVSTDYGYVEISPASGVSAEIDLTRGGNNMNVRPFMYSVKWDNIAWKNNITEYSGWTGYAANTLTYIEDNPRHAIWWFNNCSFTSNWHTGLYNGQPYWQLDGTTAGGVVPQGMDFMRNAYNQQLFFTDCTGLGMNNGFGGALLVNGCTQDYCYQDSYTNVKSCINSASTNKITPGFSGRHADHWQLFNGVTGAYENTQGETFDSVALVSNFLLYGYYGQDVNQYVQQFGFFGTSLEYYSDIAHVNCFWTGATGSGSAQIGVKYDHILNIGLTSENGSITVRSDGTQYGPVLMKDINATYISNGYQTPLNNPLGATNEFRERGTIVPNIIYTGTPSSDALLEPYYQWHVSSTGLSAAGVDNLYAAPGQRTDGTNLNLPVTATGMTTGYPDTHTVIAFGRGSSAGWTDNTRLAYNNFSNSGTTWSDITMTNFVDNAEAVAFEASGGRAGWWLKIETDQGYAYPSSAFEARASGGFGDWSGYQSSVMGGVELNADGITSSATGITFTLMKLPD